MQTKVYLAAPWKNRDEMPAIAQLFEDAGYTVTHDWWHHDDGTDPMYLRRCAVDDIQGVLEADVMLVLNRSISEGKAVEQGIAIAFGKPIVIVGRASNNIFHYLDNYTWVDSVEEALKSLENLDYMTIPGPDGYSNQLEVVV